MQFWKDFLSAKPGTYKFDICKYVTKSWDQSVNPNVKGGQRFNYRGIPPWPPMTGGFYLPPPNKGFGIK